MGHQHGRKFIQRLLLGTRVVRDPITQDEL
jgi:hypothetical protein